MAGIVPTTASINQQAGQLAINLRDIMAQIQQFDQWLNAVGGAAYLENTLQMSTTDAQTIVSTYGNLAALALVYSGGAPGAAFNYQSNTESLWGGQ